MLDHEDYHHEFETIYENPEDVSAFDWHRDSTYESKFLHCFHFYVSQHDIDMMSMDEVRWMVAEASVVCGSAVS